MTRIELTTEIHAPIERCFDLARSIDLHVRSASHTGERAIAGRTSGLIELGETVTWRARHFGIWQTLTSKIVELDRPRSFTDVMVQGAFKSFRHDHLFHAIGDRTVMEDVFVFESPFGVLGRLADVLFLRRYMTRFLETRNAAIKEAAEQ
jgi:ligand-binding SRPBCC domain-containing protein